MRPRPNAWIAAAAALLSGAAAAAEIAPHRALYEMSLAGTSDVLESARGLVAIEIRRACDGWRFSQRYELETTATMGGEPERTRFELEAEESFDGRRYAFRSTSAYSETATIALVGRATLDGTGGAARFTEPVVREVSLAADTGFPVSAIRESLDAAANGEKQIRAPWFMGAAPNEPLLVNSLIFPAPRDASAEGLLAGPRWRFVSAFFEDAVDGAPLYEGEETMLANGVLVGAVYQYDGYGLKLELRRAEPLPAPDC